MSLVYMICTVINVWEWCADLWHDSYEGAPIDGSAWGIAEKWSLSDKFDKKNDKNKRVLRGGSFLSNPFNCRAVYRLSISSIYRYSRLGIRVAAWNV